MQHSFSEYTKKTLKKSSKNKQLYLVVKHEQYDLKLWLDK